MIIQVHGVSKANKNIAIFLLKALVTAVCLWWLSRYFDYEQVRIVLAGMNPLLLVVAIALHFLSFVAGGVRWWLLFRHLHGSIEFRQVWPSYYLGVFYNNLLPSVYGGDLARTARLYASGFGGSALVSSAFVDRMLGLAAVVSMGGIALLFAPVGFEKQLALSVFGLIMLAILPMVVIAVLPKWTRLLDTGFGRRWPRLHAVLACFPRYRTAPGLMLRAFGLSVLNQLMWVLVLLMLAPGLGVHLPVFQLMLVLMLVSLVSSLPISLGGLGAREGAMMSLLLPLGVDAASVLALSVAYLLVLWCTTLPGAFMLLLREPNAPDATGL
ncbi:MAG: flippase-like domain-containing protein [Gammaproteobacteria bacterium]|nr:flippase-like domain-containing protein [Gammaproteobacteria bacterium]